MSKAQQDRSKRRAQHWDNAMPVVKLRMIEWLVIIATNTVAAMLFFGILLFLIEWRLASIGAVRTGRLEMDYSAIVAFPLVALFLSLWANIIPILWFRHKRLAKGSTSPVLTNVASSTIAIAVGLAIGMVAFPSVDHTVAGDDTSLWTFNACIFLVVPTSQFCALFMIYVIEPMWHSAKHRMRHRRGQCPACGYDVRYLPSDHCPECGYEKWGDSASKGEHSDDQCSTGSK